MTVKRDLAELDERLAELEARAAEKKQAERREHEKNRQVAKLRRALEMLYHPVHVRSMTDAERRELWPGWQLLQITSRYEHSKMLHWGFEQVAADVYRSHFEWLRDLVALSEAADARGEEEYSLPAWNWMHPVALHQLKWVIRLKTWNSFPEYGIHKARQIDHLWSRMPGGSPCPWRKGFGADRSKWWPDVRAAVEERLAESESLPPDVVPEFCWSQIPTFCYGYPFMRDREGKPTGDGLTDQNGKPTLASDPGALFRMGVPSSEYGAAILVVSAEEAAAEDAAAEGQGGEDDQPADHDQLPDGDLLPARRLRAGSPGPFLRAGGKSSFT